MRDIPTLIIGLADLVAAFLFLYGLQRMSSPATASSGIRVAGFGMAAAILASFLYVFDVDAAARPHLIVNIALAFAALAIGGGLAWWSGKRVAMTAMPQMVALYNGMGGGAAGAIAAVELFGARTSGATELAVTLLGALIGAVSLSGYPKGSVASLGVPEVRDKLKSGETMIYDVSEPTLALYRPAPGRANGTAVIVAPGGGFVGLGYAFGGTDVARALARHGIAAFVLKYRTIRSGDGPMRMPDLHMKEMDLVMARAKSGSPVEMPPFAGEPHAVEDGARAMAIVRQRASEWGIDPHKVGFIGFSAGAYLAADLAIGDAAARPAFVALIYGGLRTPVPAGAPPAFIAGAADDEYQPNDPVLLYTAWRQAGAAAELHLYEHGGHGFDLHPKGVTSDHWFDELIWWMRSRGLVAPTRNRAK